MLRDRQMHERLAELVDRYYEVTLKGLGLWKDGGPQQPHLQILASFMLAVLEGFALQREICPRDYDLEARFAFWESIAVPLIANLADPGQAPGDG